MKKILCLILSIFMLVGLVSCQDNTQQNQSITPESITEPSSTIVETENYSISLITPHSYENYWYEIKE